MDTTRIGQTVDQWIDEEDMPTGAYLKVDRTAPRYFSPTNDMEDDEAQAYWEFIQTTMNSDHQILLSVPAPEPEYNFWPIQLDENDQNVSAFNTHDFASTQRPLNLYHYRVRKVYEKVRDLAITHSCVSSDQAKKDIWHRYKNLVEKEFRDKGVMLLNSYKKYPLWVDKHRTMERIKELNSRIRKCKKIWRDYAYWE